MKSVLAFCVIAALSVVLLAASYSNRHRKPAAPHVEAPIATPAPAPAPVPAPPAAAPKKPAPKAKPAPAPAKPVVKPAPQPAPAPAPGKPRWHRDCKGPYDCWTWWG